MAEEREHFRSRSESGSGGGSQNTFMKKIGPLPLWAWMAVGLALALGYYFVRQNMAGAQTSGSSTSDNVGAATADNSVPDTAIPQFVNQTYVEPPTVNTTVNNDLPSTPAPTPTGGLTQEGPQPVAGTTVNGPNNMHPITVAQAKYLLSKKNYPYYINKTTGNYERTATIWSGGHYYAGPMDWKDYLKNGKVKG